MHPEALDAVRRMMVESDLAKHLPLVTADRARLAIDFGGADVNGTARELFDPLTTWLGLDVAPGPGVDIVADARFWDGHAGRSNSANPDQHRSIDLILCTELLEHVAPLPGDIADSGWVAVLCTIHRALRPGGYAFVTCASTGRRPHGARGEHDVPDGEWYRNVPAGVLTTALKGQGWADFGVRYEMSPGDAYAWMRKA